ncbi:MAG: 1,2-phenylacetyl-CoA epoxidase subunit B [Acidimicrobiales bacterium]|nr:1,2-phenylacetyl-CoA epoxidase subunit B [Acidimicrobiales bacterium]
MRTYEVFLKRPGKDEFRHAGSLQAVDSEMAKILARDSYCRRGEGDQMWLVDRTHIVEVDPDLLATTVDLPHRNNDGSAVAARRKRLREQAS